MNNKFLIGLIFGMIFSSFLVQANVAYVVRTSAETRVVDLLNGLGFTVDVITDAGIPSANFSQYELIVVGDGSLTNYAGVPVTTMPTLTMNSNHVDEWKIAASTGTIAVGNNYLNGKIVDTTTTIEDHTTSPMKLYDTYNIQAEYLPKLPSRATSVKNVISTNNFDSYPMIGAIPKGGALYGSGTAGNKIVYFGINQIGYWTNETEILFNNSVLWIITDFDSPLISNIGVDSLTNQSATINWMTDKNGTSSVYHGTTTDLGSSIIDSTQTMNHSIQLSELNQSTLYYYKVGSCTLAGYCRNSTVDTFTTLDLTAPSVVSVDVADVTNSSANITIAASENANMTLYYGLTTDFGNEIQDSNYQTQTSFGLNGLTEGTRYYYKVFMCDVPGNCMNSSNYNFSTTDLTPPGKVNNVILNVINSDNSINITWDQVSDSDYCEIYYGDNLNINTSRTADYTTNELSYIDSSANTVQKRFYVVRAVDAGNNKGEFSDVVGKFDLDLDVGNNLVSFPLEPFNPSLESVMHQDSYYGPVVMVKSFDNSLASFKTRTFSVEGDISIWSGTLINMSAMEGYIFRSNQNTNFTIVGAPVSNADVQINQGMNLVGLTLFDSDDDLEDVFGNTPSNYNVTEVASKGINGRYYIATYYLSNGWFGNDFDIELTEPGKAYWVKSNDDFVLEVND